MIIVVPSTFADKTCTFFVVPVPLPSSTSLLLSAKPSPASIALLSVVSLPSSVIFILLVSIFRPILFEVTVIGDSAAAS